MPAEPWLPTAEQEAAVTVEGAAAVRAGAGSGKTAVLAHRFVHLLRPRDGTSAPSVADILAITFTEKAAAEMRRKIRDVLREEAAGATGAARAHWERARRDLLGAQISTIHAFCARVLRENPLEAGIDPEAAVLDEHESRAHLEEAVEAALLTRLRRGDAAARALVLRDDLARGPRGGAVGVVTELLAGLVRTGRDAAWLRAATAGQAALVPEATALLVAATARISAAVAGALAAAGARDRGKAALADAWPPFAALLARLGAETPVEEFQTLRGLCRVLGRARLGKAVGADLRTEGGRLRGALPAAYGFLAARPANGRLAELLAEVADDIAARKREDGVLTFDDLIGEARALLTDHAAVRERYARRFRAILVDEFQDTDRVQADVIRLLAAPPGPTLFVVGDEKQSIYRFRGADVSVFHETCAALGGSLPLGTNFRSVPAILEFVNALAAHVFTPPPDGDARHWTRFDASQRLRPDRREAAARPPVRLVSLVREVSRPGLRVAEAREIEARVLAGVVERLHGEEGVAWGQMAVLFRALSDVKTYEHALRRREIPYYVVKGRGFFQCQEVSDVVSVLAALLDPTDGAALAAALRSPLFGLDDDTLWRLAWPDGRAAPSLPPRFHGGDDFADLPAHAAELVRVRDGLGALRATARRATVAELIEAVCAATDFEAVCLTQFQGRQKVANVRKLIELARDWERRRLFTLRDFVRTVRRLAATEPREPESALVGEEDDVVRLMTVHQAKGLEFRAVVLPDLGRTPPPEGRMTAVDEELGVVSGPIDAAGRPAADHLGVDRYRAREVDRERAEQARLLYVACTRARDVLVLLEGKGDAAYLAGGRGEPSLWCHQVWDVLGRDRLCAFLDGGELERVLPLAAGGTVLVERAARYLAAPGGPAPLRTPRTAPPRAEEEALVARVLDFAPPPPGESVASPTALADFRRCPRQYWYRHVLGLPERGTGGRRGALLGTAAHGVLEAIDLAGEAADDVARRLAARPEMLVLRAADRAALAADLEVAVAALRAEVAAGLEIVGREVPFVLALPRAAPRVVLEGRIDVLARRGDTWVVRDFKYAPPLDTPDERHGGQLAAYALAARAAGAERVACEVAFLRGGLAVRGLRPHDPVAEERALVDAGTALGSALATGGVDAFPRRPPGPAACAALGCGYARRCWGALVTRTAPCPPSDTAAA